jgi:hypothetical protein
VAGGVTEVEQTTLAEDDDALAVREPELVNILLITSADRMSLLPVEVMKMSAVSTVRSIVLTS